jgi:CAAX prenyl protease-like protein
MLLAIMMTTRAFSPPGLDWLYPLRVIFTMSVVAFYWPVYCSRGYLSWSGSFMPFFIGGTVFALWMALEPFSGIPADARANEAAALAAVSPTARACWIILRIIGSVIAVPLAEELAFRGYLTRQLISEDFQAAPIGQFTWFSFLVSSIVFGTLHGRWIAGIIAGMMFAIALYRRRRLMDAIIAHSTANALVTTYVLSTGNWPAWS